MRKIASAAFLFLVTTVAANATCPTFHTLSNDTTADATQVMDNFNYILNCPNFAGSVGVATAAPTALLDVNGSFHLNRPSAMVDPANTLGIPSGNNLAIVPGDLSSTNTGYISLFFPDTSTFRIGTNYDGHIGSGMYRDVQIGRYNQPYLIVKDGGNVGIGTTAPAYTLDVNGTVRAANIAPTSDARLKADIEPLQLNALDTVMALRTVTFRWRHPTDSGMQGPQIGLIAQEVEKILPSTVTTANDALRTKGIKYNELVAILIKATQEQTRLIRSQGRAIRMLQDEVQSLKQRNMKIEASLTRSDQPRLSAAN